MTTRKQQTQRKSSARMRPTKRAAAQRRPAPTRGKASSAKVLANGVREDGSLALPAECTAAEADAFRLQLTRWLDESAPVTVDMSALQRIDTAGLQLLAAFVRDRRSAGRAVVWRGRAAAFEAAAGLLGLDSMLELPGESSGR